MKNLSITLFTALLFPVIFCQAQIEPLQYDNYAVDAVQREREAEYTCIVQPTKEEMQQSLALRKEYHEAGMELKSRRDQATVIKVTAIRTMKPLAGVCIPTEGGDAPIEAEIIDDINYTNSWFSAIGFNVFLDYAGVVNVCSQFWHELDYSDTNAGNANVVSLYDAYGVNGHFNILYVGSGSYCEFPNMPDGIPDNVMVHRNTDAGWGWTVAHELGHWFNLAHTFETAYGAESVSRDPADSCYDCDTNGDGFCSTAADYGTHWCDSPDDECSCTGNYSEPNCNNGGGSVNGAYTDVCGETILPDLYNIMAYGCRPCAHTWTGEQVDAMWGGLAIRLQQPDITHQSCNGNMDQVLPATAYEGQRVESNGYIISTQQIQSHQYTLYDAASSVDLNPGFVAEQVNGIQPDFEVVNEGCYGVYQLKGKSDEEGVKE